MTVNSDVYDFEYDVDGRPWYFTHNGSRYYYVTNQQGDVIRLLDHLGAVVAIYRYNAWGEWENPINADFVLYNPLRYRGYVYDHETGLYYLHSRYYNPEMGRFINADVVFDTDAGLQGYNLFIYCGNNPVNRIDVSGADSEKIEDVDIADDVLSMFGGGGRPVSGGLVSQKGSFWNDFMRTLQAAFNGHQMAVGQGSQVSVEKHHIFSNKNQTYTPMYKEIADRYDYSLNSAANIVPLPYHSGRHTNVYHEAMYNQLVLLDCMANGDKVAFRVGIGLIADFLKNNPRAPYSK